jgi:hypothetical protein
MASHVFKQGKKRAADGTDNNSLKTGRLKNGYVYAMERREMSKGRNCKDIKTSRVRKKWIMKWFVAS